MAVNIPNSALLQVRKRLSSDSAGSLGYTIQYKDKSFSSLKTATASFARGDAVETGWLLDTFLLESIPGGGGILTLVCMPESSGTTSTPKALKAVWTCKSVRNDVSILGYCGSGNNNPDRPWIECWMKEPDQDVASSYNYRKTDGTIADINNDLTPSTKASPTRAVIEKIKSGVDSVIRFYPLLTCTSTWSRVPNTFFRNLGYVDTPSAPSADTTIAPTSLSTIISAHEWLKVQDDVQETGDGKFTRTESWMGILITTSNAHPWDPDLYGDDRWPMPLSL